MGRVYVSFLYRHVSLRAMVTFSYLMFFDFSGVCRRCEGVARVGRHRRRFVFCEQIANWTGSVVEVMFNYFAV